MKTGIHKIRTLLRQLGRQKSYALNNLDTRLRPYIDFRKGFFIEAGANDGVTQSNTLYYEKYMGWRGLLIEPIPDLAELCRKNRPKCIVENCALVADDYPEKTIEMQYCNLMSIVTEAMGNDEQDRKHIQSGVPFLKKGEEVYTIQVPARTLSSVLDKHHIARIDLLSLDVEGYETQVLKGLSLDRHSPEFLLIEVRNREEIESIIGQSYRPIAALSINESYSDMLYQRK